MPREIESRFVPTERQRTFLNTKARIRAYGGAVGGGKSRAMCQWALKLAVKYPGIQILIARANHVDIIETTRKTMREQVLPPELVHSSKRSMSEDWIQIYTGERGVYSRFNFIGFTNPEKWFSSEIGALLVDEAHETEERSVTRFLIRMRQRCRACIHQGLAECEHMPHQAALAFNPGHPGHWLRDWFIQGATQTEFGWYKPELTFSDADQPFGDCEYVISKPQDNPYLSRQYLQDLNAQNEQDKRRLVFGEWIIMDGSMFFDAEALTWYDEQTSIPWKTGSTAGNPSGDDKNDLVRVNIRRDGPLAVWKAPVTAKHGQKAHRYIVSVDVSSGGGADWTGIHVIDVEEFEQVAELQVKMDADLAAVEAYRLAVIYNGATIVPETTGGWGATIVRVVQMLNLRWKGPYPSMPVLYQRVVGQNQRLDPDYTTKFGWDTGVYTRYLMLDLLEQSLRERSFKLNGKRTHTELTQFARGKNGRPEALPGRHDDLVMSLAIGVYVAAQLPKELRRVREKPHAALIPGTGY